MTKHESNAESGIDLLRPDKRERRIEREFENRLILFCSSCDEMTRHTHDLSWHCAECGGNDLSTDQVTEMIQRDL